MVGVKALLFLTVATLHLAIVVRGIRANQLMPDAQLSSRPLKQSRQLAVGKTENNIIYKSKLTKHLCPCITVLHWTIYL